jgi:hypothetical protein
VYAQARYEKIPWQDAARAASILQILTRMIEGDTFEQRLAALEQALAERDPGRKPNGHAHREARL